MANDLLGHWGESVAAEYLRKKRYTVVDANYRCRLGEIDLIAEHEQYLCFIEVKLRRSSGFAPARAYVDGRKQQKLRTSAELFLSQYPSRLQPRFDVAEVYAPQGLQTAKPRIVYWENAF